MNKTAYRETSQRCYRVVWDTDRMPSIEHGFIVEVGEKKKSMRAKMENRPKLLKPKDVALSLGGAIRNDIDRAARYAAWSQQQQKAKPWVLVRQVTRLWRLYRNLERHHLVEKIEL